MTLAHYQRQFIQFIIDRQVLRFGRFTLKSGRASPYFFNAGLFNTGNSIGQLGRFYATAIIESGVSFRMLYGPAYKGIPLAVTTAIALAEHFGRDVPFAFNRKETKGHGEGGSIVGAPLEGHVLIVDDVVSAGTSVRESVQIIRDRGAVPAGVLIALDRQEKGESGGSAITEIEEKFGIPVISIVRLEHLFAFLQAEAGMEHVLSDLNAYRQTYGC